MRTREEGAMVFVEHGVTLDSPLNLHQLKADEMTLGDTLGIRRREPKWLCSPI